MSWKEDLQDLVWPSLDRNKTYRERLRLVEQAGLNAGVEFETIQQLRHRYQDTLPLLVEKVGELAAQTTENPVSQVKQGPDMSAINPFAKVTYVNHDGS